jgi:hypothetical protein
MTLVACDALIIFEYNVVMKPDNPTIAPLPTPSDTEPTDNKRLTRALIRAAVILHFSGVPAFLLANHRHSLTPWDPEAGEVLANWGLGTLTLCPVLTLCLAAPLGFRWCLASHERGAVALVTLLVEVLIFMAVFSPL